ncbi:sulfurtransferase [Mycobacterium kubicae]|uniref:Rhodanese-like domain-containing protein n=1 Tax=Mycobacterium kubicae TaxID=120959 RepID=A0AAX1J2R3_9MYCO|nr:rhodanese-like domain-containing protein [Mycobacterium kubicae]MCV7096079.1 rhodanese-like domain-containing protein [Mycobacterium kubicae]ORV99243.1 sulfurtransferase [Mycobacterium kubicae]QNI12236.1 rhodanese-like domain-containing protein [Mycobacterium kubicae]QPI35750.1 rhodanese-like domain-containing protein [Mycobacterium kubicae]GFG65223.1 sulfurtransferase [Mycobacterium kubicae]
MNAATNISSFELKELLESGKPPRVIDVRTPAEFETSHITGSFNVPLDVLREHRAEIVEHLDDHIVLVCKSGQRSSQASELLRQSGLVSARVLDKGIVDWESNGFTVDRAGQRWDIERQVRLVAGSIVLSSVLGSVAVPQLKWLAAGIGGGLTFAAVSNTCWMASALSKLPYNRGATSDAKTVVSQLRSTASKAG